MYIFLFYFLKFGLPLKYAVGYELVSYFLLCSIRFTEEFVTSQCWLASNHIEKDDKFTIPSDSVYVQNVK